MTWLKRFLSAVLCAALMAAAVPAFAASYTGTINADKVFFRRRASADSVYHYQLKKNTKVTVTGVSGKFYAVTYNGDKGFVMCEFVTLPSSALKALGTQKDTSKYASAKSISALGDAPGYTSKGSSGTDVEKLQQALRLKGYYKGAIDGKFGDGTRSAVLDYQKAVGISRTGKADYNTIKKLFGEVSFTTVANDPKMNGITRISQITVPATTRKGANGKNVLALQQALKIKGFYTAPIDGDYGDKTATAVKAFQKSKGLKQDGVAGNDTIKALFGANAADYTYKTERLNWFNGNVDTIPRGATFTVKDVSTGKTFTCRRWAGSNHLDAEPYSSSDTATMKAIFGGSWSWARRAVLVKYNGHVYAASMNGMPHGTSTINNGFDGHFCIHFYNSRTHETNRVDEDHQNAVARAMNATW